MPVHFVTTDAGTTANKLVQLDGSAKLPAVDGSALTNITAGVTTGQLAGGTLPASFTTLAASGQFTLTGTNLSALFKNQLATNSSFVATSDRELLLINGASGSNVMAFQSNDTTGTSAITFRDSSGNEVGATGYGNSAAIQPFRARNYYQTWSGTTFPPDYIITADGNYGSVGSGFRFYPRVGVVWDNSNSVACFNVYHHDSGTNLAFQIINAGTASSFVRIASKATDCSLQFWKDTSATKVFAIGNSMPGNAAGDDGVFATYSGGWTERMRISATTGVISVGGSTSSFPGLKRSTTVLQARLADDSAYGSYQGKLTTDTAATTGLTAGVLSALTNASITLYDSTGQAYRVPVII